MGERGRERGEWREGSGERWKRWKEVGRERREKKQREWGRESG